MARCDHLPIWKDAVSLDILRRVAEILRSRRGTVVNVDSTVLAEAPRLRPHMDAIRAGIAEAIGVEADRISVKATTCERMGAIGREEGMAAMAVVTVEQVSS